MSDIHVRCECGTVTGYSCYWSGPKSETVVVSRVPDWLVGTAIAAGGDTHNPYAETLRVQE